MSYATSATQTYGYLPCRTATPPFDWYQAMPLGDKWARVEEQLAQVRAGGRAAGN